MTSSPAPAFAPLEGRRPWIFAHRGGSGLAPENTIAAFDRGLSAGADGLELDVHLSRDGVPVVHHDATLERTTDANGPLRARTAGELSGVDAAYRFRSGSGSAFNAHHVGIPRLREVLVRYGGVPVIIEMKGNEVALAREVVADVMGAGAAGRVCLSAARGRILRAARALAPGMPSGAGRWEARAAVWRVRLGWPIGSSGYAGFQVPERARTGRIVTRRFIDAAHRAGLFVHVWTIDAPEDMARLAEWGVDGIITDRPDLAAQTLR